MLHWQVPTPLCSGKLRHGSSILRGIAVSDRSIGRFWFVAFALSRALLLPDPSGAAADRDMTANLVPVNTTSLLTVYRLPTMYIACQLPQLANCHTACQLPQRLPAVYSVHACQLPQRLPAVYTLASCHSACQLPLLANGIQLASGMRLANCHTAYQLSHSFPDAPQLANWRR